MSGIRLYFRYVSVAFRTQMQYPASFILQVLGSLALQITHLAALVMLFERFDVLGTWTLPEALIFQGMAHMASGFAMIYMRGLMNVGGMVQSGEFDRILTRPRNTVLQAMGSDLQFMRLGEFINGAVPFILTKEQPFWCCHKPKYS